VDAVLVTDVGAGAVAPGLAGAALRCDAGVAVDPDAEWIPPVEDMVDSGLALFPDTDEDDTAECSEPTFFAGLTTAGSVPVPVSSRSSVSEAAAVFGGVASESDGFAAPVAGVEVVPDAGADGVPGGFDVPAAGVVELVPDGFDAPAAVEVELVFDGASLLVEASEPGAAHATPGAMVTADPMPNATANAPTRPTCFA
jgi:hypothetical protein